MNKLTDRELKEYYSRINDAVFCDRRQKKAFLKQLKENVQEYICDAPETTIEDIEKAFGTPETIAESFIVNTDGAKIKRKLQIRRMLVVSAVVALVIYALFVVISLIDVHTEAHGYFEEGFLTVGRIIKDGGVL